MFSALPMKMVHANTAITNQAQNGACKQSDGQIDGCKLSVYQVCSDADAINKQRI